MSYNILYNIGDDPLAELAELDLYFHWTERIEKLGSLFRRKRSVNPWLVGFMILLLTLSIGAFSVLGYLALFY